MYNKGRQKTPPKKSTYVPLFLFYFYFLVRFWAFLAKRRGEFENTRTKIEYVSENFTREIFFRGGIFFRVDFDFFSFDFFVALVKRLSARGTQKRNKKCFAGSCV
jgi:hypothetical protein